MKLLISIVAGLWAGCKCLWQPDYSKENVSFLREKPHVCQRCGLCCKGRGDLSFQEMDRDWGDCCALRFDDGLAVCEVEESSGRGGKRDCCKDYPGDELCERELKEAGLWEKHLAK